MAISTPTVLDTVSAATSSATIASATLSPAANALLIVFAEATASNAATRLPASIADTFSPNLSWTKYEAEHVGASRTATAVAWVAKTGATPGSGVVTVTIAAACDRRTLHSVEVASGYNTTTPVKQSKVGGGASATLVLTLDATPDTDSLVLAAGAARNVTVITQDGDYTELAETAASTNHVGQVQYDAASADTTVQWADGGTAANAGVALEIDAAEAGIAGTAAITLDAATLAATGTLAIAGAAAVTLGDSTLSATGTLTIVGSAAITLDAVALVATGEGEAGGEEPITGEAAITLADATLAATGTLSIAGLAAVTLSAVTLSSIGTIVILGAATITLAGVTLTASNAGISIEVGFVYGPSAVGVVYGGSAIGILEG